jgi:hypothetical protein
MTDTQETRLPDGTAGSPTPPASQESSQAISGVDVKALAEALKPIISAEVAKRTQSDKDKRIGKIEAKVKGFEDQLAYFNELKEELGSEKAALRYMKLEDRSPLPTDEADEDNASPQRTALAGRTPETSKLTQALTEALGFSANDPEVTEALRKDEFALQMQAMVDLAMKRKKAAETAANPAQQMPAGGGSTISSENKDKIAAEIIRLANESPSRNYARIQELNTKLKTIS